MCLNCKLCLKRLFSFNFLKILWNIHFTFYKFLVYGVARKIPKAVRYKYLDSPDVYIIAQSDRTLQKSTGLLFPASQGRESEMEDDDIEYDITFPSPTGPEEDIEDEYVIEGEVKEPVVILLGWAGCQEKHLQKYCQIYEERSVEVDSDSV